MRHNHIPLTVEQYKRLRKVDLIDEGEIAMHVNKFWYYCKAKFLEPTDKQKRIIAAIFRNAGYRVDNGKLYKSGNYRIA